MLKLDTQKLEKFITERKPVSVDAGCLGDWYWTAATVYENGAMVENHRACTLTAKDTPGFKATMENGDVIEVEAAIPATSDDVEANRAKMRLTMDKLKAATRPDTGLQGGALELSGT